MAETYRSPQRQAVGDIVVALNELISKGNLSALAVNAEANRAMWALQRVGPPIHEARHAGTAFVSALELGRIVIVDPRCRQARDEVNLALDPVAAVLGRHDPRNIVEAQLYVSDLQRALHFLDASAGHLVDVSVSQLGPVIPWRVRLRRAGRRIDQWATAKTAEWRAIEEAERLADHVLTGFDGRTGAQAIEDGVDPRDVWRALCVDFDVPREQW
jgi:hypothetical protein